MSLCLLFQAADLRGQSGQFNLIQRLTNAEIRLGFTAPAGQGYRLDASTNLESWAPLITLRSAGLNQHTDSAAPYLLSRFYRALELTASNTIAGDHFLTAQGEVLFRPINHATFVMRWNDKTIYNDPVGGAAPFNGLPRADMILISHSHPDHFNTATLDAVKGTNVIIVAPPAVFNGLPAALKTATVTMPNGSATNLLGIGIEAVAAYTFTTSNHPKGQGNGYVLTIDGKRIYISGDTEDTPEMRALERIDAAFLCMNVPFTMSVAKAVGAVRTFRPALVYPYHYRNQDSSLADLNGFKRQVGTDLGIEVRLRKWYP